MARIGAERKLVHKALIDFERPLRATRAPILCEDLNDARSSLGSV